MKDLRVAFVDAAPIPFAIPSLTQAGCAVPAAYGSVEALLGHEERPDVVILDASAAETLAPGVRAVLQRWPTACVIVTGATPAAVSHGVAAGARGFLLKPYEASELITVVRESLESARLLRKTPRAAGRIVAVYSPKGGAGCSTIAVGLAVLSASRADTSVALVDLDLEFGDIGVMLDLRSPNSIADLLGHQRIDAALIDDTFTRHASGVRVLPAPADLATAVGITPAAVEGTLRALREHFDLIVCDLWSSLDDLTGRVLRMADCVVLVAKPELPVLKSISRVISAKHLALELDGHALIVVNRSSERGGLSAAEIEHSLARSIAVAIPSDTAAVVDAINRGISVTDARVHSRVQHAYRQLERALWDAVSPRGRSEPQRVLARV